ncbi:hypothetical protein M758_3G192100 [Ceratodon purpureus]|nr:hypothetical protein M758_3G192100 [Ceratodon purpureus]
MKKSRLLMGSATDATRTEVTTDTGIKVPYEFLVICTGSEYLGPNSRVDRLDRYQKANRKLVESQGLLIIGGGPVGVELAGEIVSDFPTKKGEASTSITVQSHSSTSDL